MPSDLRNTTETNKVEKTGAIKKFALQGTFVEIQRQVFSVNILSKKSHEGWVLYGHPMKWIDTIMTQATSR